MEMTGIETITYLRGHGFTAREIFIVISMFVVDFNILTVEELNRNLNKLRTKVKEIVEKYNDGKYYTGVKVASFDKRSKTIFDFDQSYYLTSKASPSTYQSIPGY